MRKAEREVVDIVHRQLRYEEFWERFTGFLTFLAVTPFVTAFLISFFGNIWGSVLTVVFVYGIYRIRRFRYGSWW